MTLNRAREYPTKQQFESTDDFAKRFRDAVQEESTDRIQDFDILQLGNVSWVDVRTYGAKGNGSTDDTIALQAALDTEKNVFFANTGNPYIISSMLKYYGDTHIFSNGAIIQNATGLSTPYTMMGPNSTSEENVIIEGLRFNQLSGTYSYDANSYCLSINKVVNALVTSCVFDNIITMAVWFDDTTTTTKNIAITNNTVTSSEAGGFSVFGYYDGLIINDNRLFACKDDAIAIQNSSTSKGDGAVISGNVIVDCHTQNSASSTPHGIHVFGSPNVAVVGNTINSVYASGIRVFTQIELAQTNVTIAGNVISVVGTNNGGGTVASGIEVYRTSTFVPSHVAISGNTIYDTVHDGITVRNANNVTVVGNTIKDAEYSGIALNDTHDSVVMGNVIEEAGATGNSASIYLIDDCDDNIIIGNRCEGGTNTDYGVVVQANGANNIIAHNNVSGVKTGGISDAGSGTQIFGNIGYITENRGKASDTTDGDGNITVAHGLAVTPNYASVHVAGDNTYDADVQAVDSTNITVRIKDTTDNSDVTSTAVDVYWAAEK